MTIDLECLPSFCWRKLIENVIHRSVSTPSRASSSNGNAIPNETGSSIEKKSTTAAGGGGSDVTAAAARRQTGLGRRAVTQIHIQQKKKNSYVSAVLAKSQENLAQVRH